MNKLGKLRCVEAKKFEFELKGLKMNKNGKSRCEEEKFCFTGPAERAITASISLKQINFLNDNYHEANTPLIPLTLLKYVKMQVHYHIMSIPCDRKRV